jgi:recombination protein RecA
MSRKVSATMKSIMKKLEKRYDEPVIQLMGETNNNSKCISSGRPDLDAELGGGWGVGKIIEIISEQACGKTGLALEAVAEVQKNGGLVAYIDSEHALNNEYCEQIGVDIDDLIYAAPTYGEQGIEAIRALIGSGEVDLIIVDSVTNLIPKAELEGESGEAKMALQARMMSQGLKMITGSASEAGTTIIFINQWRSSIGMYGPSKVPTGGNSLKFYASQRVEIKNKGQITDNSGVIGFKQEIRIIKNKIGTPFRVVNYDMVYGKGIDELISLMEGAIESDTIRREGQTYFFKDTKLSVGKPKLKVLLEDNPELVEEIKLAMKEA